MGTDELVVLEPAGGVPVGGDVDGRDLAGESTAGLGRGRVLVGSQRERVDLLAGNLVDVGEFLRGLDHRHVCLTLEQLGIRGAAPAGPHRVE